MTVKKWAVIGVITLGLACALIGRPDATMAAVAGLVGFLKDDSE